MAMASVCIGLRCGVEYGENHEFTFEGVIEVTGGPVAAPRRGRGLVSWQFQIFLTELRFASTAAWAVVSALMPARSVLSYS